MANCRLAALHCGRLAGGRAAADWVARENRIEFPSTERGKRQECGGLDSECMLCVCNRSSITLILTMSLGNENTNSTCINGSAVQAQRNAAAALLLTLSATTDNQRIVGQKSLGKY